MRSRCAHRRRSLRLDANLKEAVAAKAARDERRCCEAKQRQQVLVLSGNKYKADAAAAAAKVKADAAAAAAKAKADAANLKAKLVVVTGIKEQVNANTAATERVAVGA